MNDKYNKLEASHSELNIAYQRLRKTVQLLTSQNDVDAKGENELGEATNQKNGNSDMLRKLLEMLHGEFKASAIPVKQEEM